MIHLDIKEVEKILSVSRANIRFYEKEGLICTERKANNYRDYSEENLRELKKIIIFRKLGFSIAEIKQLQSGELELQDAAEANILRLEEEIEKLRGALAVTQSVAKEKATFELFDGERYWNILEEEEKNGGGFAEILHDYLMFEAEQFDVMWKRVFFHDFKKSRQKHGKAIAAAILLGICILRGISMKFMWQGSFWEGFFYPFIIFAAGSVILTPLYFLKRKNEKAAAILAGVLAFIFGAFLVGIFAFIIVLVLNYFLHFWF